MRVPCVTDAFYFVQHVQMAGSMSTSMYLREYEVCATGYELRDMKDDDSCGFECTG